jgi:phospholipase C
MVEFVPIMSRAFFRTRLRPGDQETITFSPRMGTITAFAVNSERRKPSGPPPAEPEPHPEQESRVEVSLFPPGATTPIRIVSIDNPDPVAHTPSLTFTVPGSGPFGDWTCFFRNTGRLTHEFLGTLDFAKDIAEVKKTAIPLRVLNHGLRQVIDALGIKLVLDGSHSRIEFSEDLEKVLGIGIDPIGFEVSDRVSGFAIDTAAVRAIRAASGRPAIEIKIDLEPGEVSFLNVRDFKFTLTLEMNAFGVPANRRIRLTPSLDVKVDIQAFPDFEGRIRDAALDAIKDNTGVLSLLGVYLATAFSHLARSKDEFFDIEVASRRRFIVSHFDPVAQSGDPGGVIDPTGGGVNPDDNLPPFRPKKRDASALRSLRENIDHIVVLMQENRSFDHMLGYLSLVAGRDEIDGLSGEETSVDPPEITNPVRPRRLETAEFLNSPSHDLEPVLEQIAEGEMSGFLRSFRKAYPRADFTEIMGYHTGDQLAAFDVLARNYTVCNRWFSSFPGATQPNRFCLLSGKTPVIENIEDPDSVGFLRDTTLFDALTEKGVEWRYYERDISFLRFYNRYRLDDTHIVPFDDEEEGFDARLSSNRGLPAVTFIDPDFVQIPPIVSASDDHPPANILRGQELIGGIYDKLVNSPKWASTLFVVTYDEHGGFYDHVPPPGTPKAPMVVLPVNQNGPRHLGVRVPALIMSPWVEKGSVSNVVFDHTSIGATILLRFIGDDLRVGLGRRLMNANDLSVTLKRGSARTDRPKVGKIPPLTSRRPRNRAVPGTKPDDFHEIVRKLGRPGRVSASKLVE